MLTESKETLIKLWIIGTEGRQSVLSVCCMLLVSVISPALSLTVSVSLQAMSLSSNECGSVRF